MSCVSRSPAGCLAVLLICSMPLVGEEPAGEATAGEETEFGELEEYRHCPASPRKGSWNIEVGKMSVGGIFTPLGGSTGNRVYVKTVECGKEIRMAMPAELGGEFVFRQHNGTINPALLGPVQRLAVFRLYQKRGAIKAIPKELRVKMVGPESGLMVDDPDSVAILQIFARNEGYLRELLLEPPEGLEPFKENVYHVKVKVPGEKPPYDTMEWYLAPVTQYEMYGMSTFGAPAHQQFYRWTLPKDPGEM